MKIFHKDTAVTAAKGFSIGALMTFPGMSGGTLALILNIYDRLVRAVSGLRKNFKENFLFLLVFGVSGALGMLLLSKVLLFLADTFPLPMRMLFVGLIVGGIPLLVRKMLAGGKPTAKKSIIAAICMLAGAALVFTIDRIPEGFVSFGDGFSLQTVAGVIISGFFLTIAMILPGISFSHMLIVLGIYDKFYTALSSLADVAHWGQNAADIVFLFSVGIATVIGVLALIKLLDKCMTRLPLYTYAAIIGFVIASIKNVINGQTPIQGASAGSIIAAVLLFIAGAAVVLSITGKNNKPRTKSPKSDADQT